MASTSLNGVLNMYTSANGVLVLYVMLLWKQPQTSRADVRGAHPTTIRTYT